MAAKWPSGVPVFWNELRQSLLSHGSKEAKAKAQSYPKYVVGTDVTDNWMPGVIEGIRPDNQDRVFYSYWDLLPLNDDAEELQAIAKAQMWSK